MSRIVALLLVLGAVASALLVPARLAPADSAEHRPVEPAATAASSRDLVAPPPPAPPVVAAPDPVPAGPVSAEAAETPAAAGTDFPAEPPEQPPPPPETPPAPAPPPGAEAEPPAEPPPSPADDGGSGGLDALPVDEPVEPVEPVAPVVEVPDLRGDAAEGTGAVGSALADALDSLAARAPAGGCLVIRRDGETVFARNAEAPLVPASLQKLVLAEAALDILGPDYTFTTVASARAEPVGGVLAGDLYLVGAGDPLLASPHYVEMLARHGGVGTPLADLAASLVAAGLTRVEGGVVAVADRYDARTDVPEWPARFASQSVAGSLSAVAVDQGWRAPPGIESTWGLTRHPAPAQRAAELFDDLLEARSVRLPQVPRVAAGGADYSGHAVLAAVTSAPLAHYLHYLLAESDNTAAEMLLKELGRVAQGSGTTRAGALAVQQALAPRVAGLPVPSDGSGLSPRNRLTCTQTADVLDLSGPDGYVGANLGVAGRSGTMENRYRNSPAAGLVAAKTGSLDGVSAVAGFADGPGGETFTFAVIFNSGGEWLDRDGAVRFFAELMEILVVGP